VLKINAEILLLQRIPRSGCDFALVGSRKVNDGCDFASAGSRKVKNGCDFASVGNQKAKKMAKTLFLQGIKCQNQM